MPAPVIVHEKCPPLSLTPDNFSTSLICTFTIGKEGGEEGGEEGARPGGKEGARALGVLGDTGGEEGDTGGNEGEVIGVRRNLSSGRRQRSAPADSKSRCGHMGSPGMTPRIVGGTEVPADTFPYPFATSLESFGFQICGASLIAPQWILTAAHCVDASAAPSQYSAYLHGFHLGVYTHECSERLQAVQIVCHEDFDKASSLCVSTSAAPSAP